jgi:hypothetical protein
MDKQSIVKQRSAVSNQRSAKPGVYRKGREGRSIWYLVLGIWLLLEAPGLSYSKATDGELAAKY